MDILISSNLERMLYELTGHNDKQVAAWQDALKNEGEYTVSEDVLAKLKDIFFGGFCSEAETAATIKNVFEEYGYLIDTHTAVAVSVYKDYKQETGDCHPTVIASTASPYKFANSVLEALGQTVPVNEFDAAEKLSTATKTNIPAPIAALKTAEVRFNNVCEKDDMNKVVLNHLGIK